jgi:hypothetical protein
LGADPKHLDGDPDNECAMIDTLAQRGAPKKGKSGGLTTLRYATNRLRSHFWQCP